MRAYIKNEWLMIKTNEGTHYPFCRIPIVNIKDATAIVKRINIIQDVIDQNIGKCNRT